MLEIAFESLEANLKTYFSRVCLANWISSLFYFYLLISLHLFFSDQLEFVSIW